MSSTDQTLKPIRFVAKGGVGKEFSKVVKKRVKAYFADNNIEKIGDYRMWIKVIAMPLIYFIPFIAILTDNYSHNLPIFFLLWFIMGVGVGGIGMGMMHDANHGSIAKDKGLNNFIGMVINLAGGYALNWKIQHNVLHHTYTNVDGYDEDIEPAGVMRFSPHQPHKFMFKFQAFYAWFLYGLMTLTWVLHKDFVQLSRYNRKGLVKAQGKTYSTELMKMIFSKIFYYFYVVYVPLFVLKLDVSYGMYAIGFVLMHFTAGLILGLVFQPAHVVPNVEFPLPNKDNVVEGDWFVHQMLTTADFAPNNKILNWYVGGLNFQIEHHLFPTISHIHYPELAKIVRKTAAEFDIPYNFHPTYFGAIANHASMLWKFSKADAVYDVVLRPDLR